MMLIRFVRRLYRQLGVALAAVVSISFALLVLFNRNSTIEKASERYNVEALSIIYGDAGETSTTVITAPSNHRQTKRSSDVPDFTRLADRPITLHDFDYLINQPNLCRNRGIDFLILVHTAPNNVERRRMIRKTFGQISTANNFNLSTLFFLGTTGNKTLNDLITRESRQYKDIVQESFHDSYTNMTLKHVMVMKWATLSCKSAKFLMKIDDDVLVNVDHVTSFLTERLKRGAPSKFLYCKIFYHNVPHRKKGEAWYVPIEEYPLPVYPKYCEGYAYIFSQDVASAFYNISQYLPYFWIDDVHVTGTVRQFARVEPEQSKWLHDFSLMSDAVVKSPPETFRKTMVFLARWPELLKNWYKIWERIKQQRPNKD